MGAARERHPAHARQEHVTVGYPGPADQKTALVQSKYIIVDMFAKAVQGDTPEAAVAWAENEMKQAYGQ